MNQAVTKQEAQVPEMGLEKLNEKMDGVLNAASEAKTVADELKAVAEEAKNMAESVKKLTGADIGIGTTAGIGEGGIAVHGNETVVIGTSDVYADLTNIDNDLIFKRESFGIDNALGMLELVISKDFY